MILNIPWILYHKILFRRRYYNAIYNPRIEAEVKKTIRGARGDVFIDIGSNVGYYSKLARKRFKKVISVDPNPKYHAEIQLAISNKNGRAMFYFGDGKGAADSLIHNLHNQGKEWENGNPIQVETITYDQLMLDADLVKIDVEGAEFEVIEGMNLHKSKKAIIELHDERRENELLQKMAEKGYIASQLDHHHWLFVIE
jgi:FkbM family methyltransferase